MMPRSVEPLHLERVRKTYGTVIAVDDISLTISPGRFLTILGPSGSGKTTLLMMIAGFVTPSSGAIRLGARDITLLPPEKRDFGMVFQGYALFPHLSVRENIAFALRLRRMAPQAIHREIEGMLELVQLTGLDDRLPRQLSGGQQQRVALARALVFNPKLLLLDEPLSALDKKLRAGLQEELRALHQRLGTTFIFVTHDQEEALSMSDEIAIMNHGRIVQLGSPGDLYDRPVSRFVADFLGRSNFLKGEFVSIEGATLLYRIGAETFRQRWTGPPPGRGRILVGLRPEKIVVSLERPASMANALVGRIVGTAFHGTVHHLRVETRVGLMQATLATWKSPVDPVAAVNIWLSWDEEASVMLKEDG
jgi:putative spermidine/putrescine transport system ATP-binding protein